MSKASALRSLAAIVGVLSAIGSTAGAAPALAESTIGVTGPVSTFFGAFDAGAELIETSAAVPASGGAVTPFQTQSGTPADPSRGGPGCAPGGAYDFQILRPAANGTYLLLGHTGTQADPCDGRLHSYPVNIPVQAGDVLGVYVVTPWRGSTPYFGNGMAYVDIAYDALAQQPAVGQTVKITNALLVHQEYGLDESATFLGGLPGLRAAVAGLGPGRSLADKVSSIQASLAAGHRADACSALTAFIQQVRAQSGKGVLPITATTLLNNAKQIAEMNGCSTPSR